MRTNYKTILKAGALLVTVAAGDQSASAKDVKMDIDGKFYQLPEGAKTNLDPVRTLLVAANGLGMVRVANWVNDITEGDGTRMCVGCTTDMYEYRGSGTFDGKPVKDLSIHFDLKLLNARIDATAADGSRTVVVAKGNLTWDETKPGVFKAVSSVPAAERMLPVYLLPQTAIVFGAQYADKIKSGKAADGLRTLTVPVAPLGTDLTASIDETGYIVRTEFRYGGKLYSGDYSEYGNDKMDYHVMAPHKVVQKIDGKTVTDLTLEYHWVNPYLAFPTPKEIGAR